jgi:hypothetical protein
MSAFLDPEAILASPDDLVGQAILAQGEPSYETAAPLLPPLRGYVPVSAPPAGRKLVIDEAGRIGYLSSTYSEPRVREAVFDPRTFIEGPAGRPDAWSLLGGWLPGVQCVWLAMGGQRAEHVAFALPQPPHTVFVALTIGARRRAFALEPLRELTDESTSLNALASFRGHWQRALSSGMSVELPERPLHDASLAALARAMCTYVGDHPKYGLGGYADPVHDGFPPTTLWMVHACLAWGLLERARAYLSTYFDQFVREDGTFAYYGPAVSEYGQMLDLVCEYVRYTGDGDWLRAQGGKVRAIAAYLLALREESLKQPSSAAARGLPYGSPEADTREDREYYLSGAAWLWRGLVELLRLSRDLRVAEIAPDGVEEQCEGLREDLDRAARESIVPGDPPFLPPYPGLDKPFPSMTADTLASYTNYRYWPELLSAEALEPDLMEPVFEYRRREGGELSATTRFEDRLDDWPFAHQASAFLATDRIDQYLLGLYGHLAFHQTPGTYCAYEQVAVRGGEERRYVADYCVPAQLTVPLLVRWMLVSEERDQDALWLCRAVPRRWFAPGEHSGVTNVPTRWGPVSFEVRATQESVEVEIQCPLRGPEELLLRVRRPDGGPPVRVTVNGQAVGFDPRREVLRVGRPTGRLEVRLAYA